MGEAQGAVIYIPRVTFLERRREPRLCFSTGWDKDSLYPNSSNYEKYFVEHGQGAKEAPLPCSALFPLLKTLPYSLGGKNAH